MAAEFDAQAAAIEASVATAHVIGYGDDVTKAREDADEVPGTGNDRVRDVEAALGEPMPWAANAR